jgi:16S rRNA (cytidine1402-2'-O)-methyltransferase
MSTADEPKMPGALAARLAAEAGRWLAEPLAVGLHIVATPIGNLGDITVRALATLARADVVCCEDTRHSRTLLAHYGITRQVRALHEHNEAAATADVLALLADGQTVALISDAGTPLVSDPGHRLVRAAIDAGHIVHALPGPSALLAGLVVSGLPADTVLFTGFAPARDSARRERLAELMAVPATLVLFEAPGRLAALLADLEPVAGSRPVVVARELTKHFEEVRRGTARELRAGLDKHAVRGEVVLVVGPPAPRSVSDEEIARLLTEALTTQSLRDAARAVAAALGVPRSRVYDLGLKAQAGRP